MQPVDEAPAYEEAYEEDFEEVPGEEYDQDYLEEYGEYGEEVTAGGAGTNATGQFVSELSILH